MRSNHTSPAPLCPALFAWRQPQAVPLWLAVPLLAGCGILTLPGGAPAPAAPQASAAVTAAPSTPSVEPAPAVTSDAVEPAAASKNPPAASARRPPPPPDAVPRVERIPQREPNRPYVVRGDAYEPMSTDLPLQQTGVASWYGEPFHGRRTANGEVYDMNQMTAAHKTMPLPSYALVRNLRNGRQIVVRVNDRGPFKYDRVIDLSRAAARKLGFTGLAKVEVRRLTHEEIRTGAWRLVPQTLASLDTGP